MKHISSYKLKASRVFLTLGASLAMVVAGCTMGDSPEAVNQPATVFTTVTVAATVTEESVVTRQNLPSDSGLVPDTDYNIFTGPNYTDKVILTFDDCPKTFEQLVSTVSTARANDIGLVLAPTGNCIAKFERLGLNIIDVMRSHGQYVINHSVTHPAMSTLSHTEIVAELAVPGVVTNYGRPPYGDGFFSSDYSQVVADAYEYANMRPWIWTVDTQDWKGQSANEIVSYVVNNSNEQDTVLMHMNHNAFNAEAVVAMKNGLNARGLEVCNAHGGTTPGMLPDKLPC